MCREGDSAPLDSLDPPAPTPGQPPRGIPGGRPPSGAKLPGVLGPVMESTIGANPCPLRPSRARLLALAPQGTTGAGAKLPVSGGGLLRLMRGHCMSGFGRRFDTCFVRPRWLRACAWGVARKSQTVPRPHLCQSYSPSQMPIFSCAGKGSRTPTPLRADGFEPSAYTIPPPRRAASSIAQRRQ